MENIRVSIIDDGKTYDLYNETDHVVQKVENLLIELGEQKKILLLLLLIVVMIVLAQQLES